MAAAGEVGDAAGYLGDCALPLLADVVDVVAADGFEYHFGHIGGGDDAAQGFSAPDVDVEAAADATYHGLHVACGVRSDNQRRTQDGEGEAVAGAPVGDDGLGLDFAARVGRCAVEGMVFGDIRSRLLAIDRYRADEHKGFGQARLFQRPAQVGRAPDVYAAEVVVILFPGQLVGFAGGVHHYVELPRQRRHTGGEVGDDVARGAAPQCGHAVALAEAANDVVAEKSGGAGEEERHANKN